MKNFGNYRKSFVVLFIAMLVIAAGYLMWSRRTGNETAGIIYRNSRYGFSFSLPESWKGYSIVTDAWKGNTSGPGGDMPLAQGPLLSIRHPQWTAENPRQDIPIIIFTVLQWSDLQQDKFHIGAAPIGPSELGRNSKYIFALPARYNFAYPAGFEEVDMILRGKPLHAF